MQKMVHAAAAATKRGAVALSAAGTLAVLGFMLAGPASAAETNPALDAVEGFGSQITAFGTAIVALVVLATGIWFGIRWFRKGVSRAS